MKQILFFALALSFTIGASAQKVTPLNGADEAVRLWDNSSAKYSNHESREELWYKNNTRIKYTSSCDLHIFKAAPEKNSGVAIAIYPGGGFTSVGMSTSLAKWFASVGITAAIVKYRLPNGHNEATLEDAMGAVRYLRSRTDLGIDPAKVGVTGSSAGGHIAAWVSCAMPDGEKPAFSIPRYGSMSRVEFYIGSSANKALLGKGFCFQDAVDMSVQNMVTSTTPPTLLLLCDDDRVVESKSSVIYYEALIHHGVKASMHIFPMGGHSLSKHNNEYMSLILDWLNWLGLYNLK